jgi:hypothetical protein
MRRVWHELGTVMLSCLLAGCGGGESTATPENLDAASEAAKKMRLRELAAAKDKSKTATAPKAEAGATESPKKGGG